MPATGSLEYVGQNGFDRTAYKTYYGAIGPRFGFAYRIGHEHHHSGRLRHLLRSVESGRGRYWQWAAGFRAMTSRPTLHRGQARTAAVTIPARSLAYRRAFTGARQLTGHLHGTWKHGERHTGPRNGIKFRQEQSWSFGIEHQFRGTFSSTPNTSEEKVRTFISAATLTRSTHLPPPARQQLRKQSRRLQCERTFCRAGDRAWRKQLLRGILEPVLER